VAGGGVVAVVGGTKADDGDFRILLRQQVDEVGPMKRPRSTFVHGGMMVGEPEKKHVHDERTLVAPKFAPPPVGQPASRSVDDIV